MTAIFAFLYFCLAAAYAFMNHRWPRLRYRLLSAAWAIMACAYTAMWILWG